MLVMMWLFVPDRHATRCRAAERRVGAHASGVELPQAWQFDSAALVIHHVRRSRR
jgi:hypothetical protein